MSDKCQALFMEEGCESTLMNSPEKYTCKFKMCTCMNVLLSVIIIGYVSLVTCFECPHSFKREDGTCCKSAICEKDEQFKYCTETKSIGVDHCKHCPPGTGNTQSVNTSNVYNKLGGGTYNRCLKLKCKCPDGARIVECAYNILDVKCECNTPWNYGPDPNTCNKSTQEQLRLQHRAGFELLQDGSVRECKEGRHKLHDDNSSCIPHTSCKDDEVMLRPGSSTENVLCSKKDFNQSTTTKNFPDKVDNNTGTFAWWSKVIVIILSVIFFGAVVCLLICICKRKSCRRAIKRNCNYGLRRLFDYSPVRQNGANIDDVMIELSIGNADGSRICFQDQDSVNERFNDAVDHTQVKSMFKNVSNEESGQGDKISYAQKPNKDISTRPQTRDTSIISSYQQNSSGGTDYTGNSSTTQSTSMKTFVTQESTGSTRPSTHCDSVISSSLNPQGHTDSLTTGSTSSTPSTQNDSVTRTSFTSQSSAEDIVSNSFGRNNNGTRRAQRPIQIVPPMTRAVVDVDGDRIAQPVDQESEGMVYYSGRFLGPVHYNIEAHLEGHREEGQSNPESPREDSNVQSPEDIQSESSQLLSDLPNVDTLNIDMSDSSELPSDDLLLRVTPNTDDSSNVYEETGLKS